MLSAQVYVIGCGAAAEGRKHLIEFNPANADGFSRVMRLPNQLAVSKAVTTLWIEGIHTVVSTCMRTTQQRAA